MRKITTIMCIGIMCIALIGCNSATKMIKQKTLNERSNIFAEIKNDDIPGKGSAVVNIKATVKTHLEKYYLFESPGSMCGKPGYPFLFNIAGQATLWQVNGQREIVPLYDKNGKTSSDPDAGDGIKYILERTIKVHAGTYKVFLGLPNENYYKEVEINFQEGNVYVMEFKPVYKYKTTPNRIPNFMRRIKEFNVCLNGVRL